MLTSEQYVESVKQMMNQQSIFFSIFLAILAIVLGFIGVIQWRLSSKQIELIKKDTIKETEKDIADKLNVSSISEIPQLIESKVKLELKDYDKMIDRFNSNEIDYQFRFRLDLYQVMEADNWLPKAYMLLDIYKTLLANDIGTFNMYINNLIHSISKKIQEGYVFSDQEKYMLKEIREKLSSIENKYDENSNLNQLDIFLETLDNK